MKVLMKKLKRASADKVEAKKELESRLLALGYNCTSTRPYRGREIRLFPPYNDGVTPSVLRSAIQADLEKKIREEEEKAKFYMSFARILPEPEEER